LHIADGVEGEGVMRRRGDRKKRRFGEPEIRGFGENAKMEENKNLKMYEYALQAITLSLIFLILAPRPIAPLRF
jgi:hypothetical protein